MTARADGALQPRQASPRLAALLFVAALGVLAVSASMTLASGAGFEKYQVAAEGFSSGALPRARQLDFSPLYLALSTAAARCFGSPAGAMVVLQVVLAALAVTLTYILLARRMTAPFAVLGASMVLFCRSLLVYQTVLEPEIVLLFLITLLLVLAGRTEAWAALAAGAVAGLALATRPSVLPMLVLVPAGYAFAASGPARRRRTVTRSLLFGLPVALTLALSMARSAWLVGDALAPAMSPGTVFFEGNQPLSAGISAEYPPSVLALAEGTGDTEPDAAHRHYREVAAAATGASLDVRAANAFWRRHALAFIRAEPGHWLRRLVAKLTLAFNARPIHDTVAAWSMDRALALPALPFAVLAGLALTGLLFAARELRPALLLYGLVFSQLAVMLVFYVSARQRLVMLPALAYFAAVAAARMVRPGGWRPAVLAAAVAVCLFLPQPVIEELDARYAATERSRRLAASLRAEVSRDGVAPHRSRVVAWLAMRPQIAERQRPAFLPQDDLPFAEQVLAGVLARGAAAAAFDRFDRAVALLAAGRLEAADQLIAGLMAEGYAPYRSAQPSTLEHYRAEIALARADPADAIRWLQRALEVSPGDPFSLALLVASSADSAARADLEAFWGRIDSDWLLGRAHLEVGRSAAAIGPLERVVAALPALRDAQIDLAAALAAVGRDDEAVARFVAANRARHEPVLRDPEIPDLFRRWHAAAPSPERSLLTAQVLHTYGYLRPAQALLEPIERLAAGDPAAPFAAAVRQAAARLARARAALSEPR